MKKKITLLLLVTIIGGLMSGCSPVAKNLSEVDVKDVEVKSTEVELEVEEVEEVQQETKELNAKLVKDVQKVVAKIVADSIESKKAIAEAAVIVEPVIEEPAVVEPVAPKYTYTDMTLTKYAKSSVNVRDLPNTEGNKLGSLTLNTVASITGQCNETGWYRIAYSGGVGYVSNSYLVDSEVVVKQPVIVPEVAKSPAVSTPAPAAADVNPYTLYTLIDEGGPELSFYWLFDGTAMKPADYWRLNDEAIAILKERMPSIDSLTTNYYGSDKGYVQTGYFVNGKEVIRTYPVYFFK